MVRGWGDEALEMMRHIRHGLLEKKRNAFASSNVTPKKKLTMRKDEGKAMERKGTASSRRSRRAGYEVETSSVSAAQKAIDYFENKKRERANSAPKVPTEGTCGMVPEGAGSASDSLGRSMGVSSHVPDADVIHVELPSAFDVAKSPSAIAKTPSTWSASASDVSAPNISLSLDEDVRSDHMQSVHAERPHAERPHAERPHAERPRRRGCIRTQKHDQEKPEEPEERGEPDPDASVADAGADADGIKNGEEEEAKRARKRRRKRRGARTQRTYKLGKKGRKVSVMIYGQNTREAPRRPPQHQRGRHQQDASGAPTPLPPQDGERRAAEPRARDIQKHQTVW